MIHYFDENESPPTAACLRAAAGRGRSSAALKDTKGPLCAVCLRGWWGENERGAPEAKPKGLRLALRAGACAEEQGPSLCYIKRKNILVGMGRELNTLKRASLGKHSFFPAMPPDMMKLPQGHLPDGTQPQGCQPGAMPKAGTHNLCGVSSALPNLPLKHKAHPDVSKVQGKRLIRELSSSIKK